MRYFDLPIENAVMKNWGKIGEKVIGFRPQTKVLLLFGPPTSVQYFVKIEQKMRS